MWMRYGVLAGCMVGMAGAAWAGGPCPIEEDFILKEGTYDPDSDERGSYSCAQLVLIGLNPQGFLPEGQDLVWGAVGEALMTGAQAQPNVWVGEGMVPAEKLVVTPETLTLKGGLSKGAHTVLVTVNDKDGATVENNPQPLVAGGPREAADDTPLRQPCAGEEILPEGSDPESDESAAYSCAKVKLLGVNPQSFLPVGQDLVWALVGEAFATEQGSARVWVNDRELPATQLVLTASTLTVKGLLADGLNRIRIHAVDRLGGIVESHDDKPLVAGSEVLEVKVTDAAGVPVADAEVDFTLNEYSEVQFTVRRTTDASGMVRLANVPRANVYVAAQTNDRTRYASGEVLRAPEKATLTLVLRGMDAPSAVENNKFEKGTAEGWVTSPGAAVDGAARGIRRCRPAWAA